MWNRWTQWLTILFSQKIWFHPFKPSKCLNSTCCASLDLHGIWCCVNSTQPNGKNLTKIREHKFVEEISPIQLITRYALHFPRSCTRIQFDKILSLSLLTHGRVCIWISVCKRRSSLLLMKTMQCHIYLPIAILKVYWLSAAYI